MEIGFLGAVEHTKRIVVHPMRTERRMELKSSHNGGRGTTQRPRRRSHLNWINGELIYRSEQSINACLGSLHRIIELALELCVLRRGRLCPNVHTIYVDQNRLQRMYLLICGNAQHKTPITIYGLKCLKCLQCSMFIGLRVLAKYICYAYAIR